MNRHDEGPSREIGEQSRSLDNCKSIPSLKVFERQAKDAGVELDSSQGVFDLFKKTGVIQTPLKKIKAAVCADFAETVTNFSLKVDQNSDVLEIDIKGKQGDESYGMSFFFRYYESRSGPWKANLYWALEHGYFNQVSTNLKRNLSYNSEAGKILKTDSPNYK